VWSVFQCRGVQIVLRTHQRPQRLNRALRHLREQWPKAGLFVVDDARSPSARQLNRVAMLKRGVQLDRGARRAWIEYLSAGSVALQDILSWALLGPESADTPGAAFNTGLLLLAGGRGLIMDDDVVPLVAPAPQGCCGPAGDPTAMHLFETTQDALRSVEGRLQPLSRVLDDGPAPVRSFGVVGDSGMRSTAGYYHRGGAWLAEQAEAWPEVRASRQVHRAVPTATRGRHLMSTCLALDLRHSMPPPMLPVGRNADGLWGQALTEEQVPLHCPWSVLHLPGRRASSAEAGQGHLLKPRMTDLLGLYAPHHDGGPTQPQGWPERLKGPWRAHLERLALRLDDARRATPRHADRLHADLEAVLRSLPQAAQAVPEPVDLPSEGVWTHFGRIVDRLGELQDAWPEVWDRAIAGRINAETGALPFPRVIGFC